MNIAGDEHTYFNTQALAAFGWRMRVASVTRLGHSNLRLTVPVTVRWAELKSSARYPRRSCREPLRVCRPALAVS